MAFTRTTTINAAPGGDSTKQAVLDLDTDLTGAFTHLNTLDTTKLASATAGTTYAPIAKGVTNGDSHDHSGGDGAQIAYSSLSGTPDPSDYAPAAKGVTNGDSHDHSGGDGGTIAYSSLSGAPTSFEPSDGDKGDITVSNSGATWTIDANVVTPAKMSRTGTTGQVLTSGGAGADPSYVNKYATGDVLQVLAFTDSGGSTTSATLANVTSSAKSITPKSSNSTIIVICSCTCSVSAGGAGTNTTGGLQLYNNTTSADIGPGLYSFGVASGGGTNMVTYTPVTIAAHITNSGTSAIGFLLRARYTAASSTVSASNHEWIIIEVQN